MPRDAERFALELIGGIEAGRDLLHGNTARPRPLVPPRRAAQPLSEETAAVAKQAAEKLSGVNGPAKG